MDVAGVGGASLAVGPAYHRAQSHWVTHQPAEATIPEPDYMGRLEIEDGIWRGQKERSVDDLNKGSVHIT